MELDMCHAIKRFAWQKNIIILKAKNWLLRSHSSINQNVQSNISCFIF